MLLSKPLLRRQAKNNRRFIATPVAVSHPFGGCLGGLPPVPFARHPPESTHEKTPREAGLFPDFGASRSGGHEDPELAALGIGTIAEVGAVATTGDLVLDVVAGFASTTKGHGDVSVGLGA